MFRNDQRMLLYGRDFSTTSFEIRKRCKVHALVECSLCRWKFMWKQKKPRSFKDEFEGLFLGGLMRLKKREIDVE